jgi:hypothetical protein
MSLGCFVLFKYANAKIYLCLVKLCLNLQETVFVIKIWPMRVPPETLIRLAGFELLWVGWPHCTFTTGIQPNSHEMSALHNLLFSIDHELTIISFLRTIPIMFQHMYVIILKMLFVSNSTEHIVSPFCNKFIYQIFN